MLSSSYLLPSTSYHHPFNIATYIISSFVQFSMLSKYGILLTLTFTHSESSHESIPNPFFFASLAVVAKTISWYPSQLLGSYTLYAFILIPSFYFNVYNNVFLFYKPFFFYFLY